MITLLKFINNFLIQSGFATSKVVNFTAQKHALEMQYQHTTNCTQYLHFISRYFATSQPNYALFHCMSMFAYCFVLNTGAQNFYMHRNNTKKIRVRNNKGQFTTNMGCASTCHVRSVKQECNKVLELHQHVHIPKQGEILISCICQSAITILPVTQVNEFTSNIP